MALYGKGVQFLWNGKHVAELKKIGGIELSAETIDVTSHDTEGDYKDFISGLKEASDISLEGFFAPDDTDGQLAMYEDFNSGEARNVAMVWPNSIARWDFKAIVTKIKPVDGEVNGSIPFVATIKPKGKPNFTINQSGGLTTPFFAISDSADINPAPAADIHEYVATVLTGVSSVTVTPTATNGVITVNNSIVESGNASSSIALGEAGSITPITIKIQEENKSPVIYTIHVSRP